jgi:ubiquitin carboxyl-terminal hydrolase 5/13
MGTITAEGKGEVNCYARRDPKNPLSSNCNDIVAFDKLALYLTHFGIDVKGREATEATQLDLTNNMMLNANSGSVFAGIPSDDLKAFVFGPRRTGLQNLGNSCYMASAIQVLFSAPSVAARYSGAAARQHLVSCAMNAPAKCFQCQMSKLALGLMSGEYSPAPTPEQLALFAAKRDCLLALREAEQKAKAALEPYLPPTCPEVLKQWIPPLQNGVSPRAFKALLCSSHEDYKTGKQQDSVAFLQWLLDQIRTREKKNNLVANPDPTSCFDFVTEERLCCLHCQATKYKQQATQTFMLPVPMPADYAAKAEEERRKNLKRKREQEAEAKAKALALAEGKTVASSATAEEKKEDEKKAEDVVAPAVVPFAVCLAAALNPEVVEFKCPNCGAANALKTTKLATFPDVMLVQAARWDHTGWVPKKLNVKIPIPLTPVDFASAKASGLQPGERAMAEPAKSKNVEPQYSAALVQQMAELGLGENLSKRALIACRNSLDAAINWAFEHSCDDGVNDPLPGVSSAPSAAADPREAEALGTLSAMGFGPEKWCKFALSKTGYDIMRALTFMESHDPSEADAAESKAAAPMATDNGPTRFQLIGFITHLGNSFQSGHYIAHLREGGVGNGDGSAGEWLIYNDAKVFCVETPPTEDGYLYVFKRL